jgi:hypothetical protein
LGQRIADVMWHHYMRWASTLFADNSGGKIAACAQVPAGGALMETEFLMPARGPAQFRAENGVRHEWQLQRPDAKIAKNRKLRLRIAPKTRKPKSCCLVLGFRVFGAAFVVSVLRDLRVKQPAVLRDSAPPRETAVAVQHRATGVRFSSHLQGMAAHLGQPLPQRLVATPSARCRP